MKNLYKLIGIIALVAIFTLSFSACKDPTDTTPVKTLTSITLNHASVKKAYTQGQALNLAGLVVTANYSDSTGAAVTTYTANPADGAALNTIGNDIKVTISFSEGGVTKTADFSVTVAAPIPDDVTYTVAQTGGTDGTADSTGIVFTFNGSVSGLTVDHITLTNGTGTATKGALTGSGVSWTLGITVTTAGNVTAAIAKTGIEAGTKNVTVYSASGLAPTLTGITLNTTSVNKTYTQGQTLNLSGLVVTANYSDSTSATVTTYTANPANGETLNTIGQITVTISYTEGTVTQTATFTVNVSAVTPTKTLNSITAAYTGGNVEINSNVDSLKTALTVTAHYTDNSTQPVSNYSLNGDLTAIGQKTITVTYELKTTTFTVTVVCTNHNWGNWTTTKAATETEDGEETRTCSICGTTETQFNGEYATGTEGLSFTAIDSNTAYRVSKGTITGGAVHIPAYWRGNSTNYEDYKPVTEIDYNAFTNTTITSVTIPTNVTLIGDLAFSGCISLTSITIPASVTLIGDSAFSGCISLTSITIPASVTSIGIYVFLNCASLTAITVDGDNPNYASHDGILYNKTKTEMVTVPEGISNNVIIPEGVISIGDAAFRNCNGLTSINIPASVTSIGEFAFNGCTSLETVTFAESSKLVSIGRIAFYQCTSLNNITIPASVTEIGAVAFSSCTSLTSFNIPAGIMTIAQGTFEGCSSLTEITIPASVTSIVQYAFNNCTNLASITISENVTTIGNQTFGNWNDLQTIYIEGHATEAEADDAWGYTQNPPEWGQWQGWRARCNAVIKYWNGSSYQ